MSKQAGWWAAVAVVMAGCDSSPATEECAGGEYVPRMREVELADLPRVRPVVSYRNGSPSVSVVLRYDDDHADNAKDAGRAGPIADRKGAFCPLFHVHAQLGADAVVGEATGWRCDGPGGASCDLPGFALLAPEAAALPPLVISDDSTSITIDLGDIAAPRTATLVESPDWTLHAGAPASVRWRPASDLASYDVRVYVELACDACPGGHMSIRLQDVTEVGDLIQFTTPEMTGPVTVTFLLDGGPVDRPNLQISATQQIVQIARILP